MSCKSPGTTSQIICKTQGYCCLQVQCLFCAALLAVWYAKTTANKDSSHQRMNQLYGFILFSPPSRLFAALRLLEHLEPTYTLHTGTYAYATFSLFGSIFNQDEYCNKRLQNYTKACCQVCYAPDARLETLFMLFSHKSHIGTSSSGTCNEPLAYVYTL